MLDHRCTVDRRAAGEADRNMAAVRVGDSQDQVEGNAKDHNTAAAEVVDILGHN